MSDEDTMEKAQHLASLLTGSPTTTITEDLLPGGIPAYEGAIEVLRNEGHDIQLPKAPQRNLAITYPGECKGRVIQLVRKGSK